MNKGKRLFFLMVSCTLLAACRSSKVSSSSATSTLTSSVEISKDSSGIQRQTEEDYTQTITIDSMEVYPYDDTIIEVKNGKAKLYGIKINSKGERKIIEVSATSHSVNNRDSISSKTDEQVTEKMSYPKWPFIVGVVCLLFLIAPMIWRKVN